MVKEVKKLTPAEVIASEDALMDFQFAVIDALNAKGITQVDFAEMLGVSRARVSQMLSSEANPTIKLVGRALHVLGLKANYCPLEAAMPVEVAVPAKDAQPTLESALQAAEEIESYWDFDFIEMTEAVAAPRRPRSAAEDSCRWSAQQFNYEMDWRGPRVGANSNGNKKLAAA